MLIESLAQKTKLALMTVLATIGGCTLICGFTVWCCISLVTKERKQIYILDGDIPFLAQCAQLEANFTMEAKAHIQLFHQYFFNLPPDNDYIKWTVGKAMYMADGTALKQKQAMASSRETHDKWPSCSSSRNGRETCGDRKFMVGVRIGTTRCSRNNSDGV